MARDTIANPRRNDGFGTKPGLVYPGQQINPETLDAETRRLLCVYVEHRYKGVYPRPKLDPFDKGYAASKRALIAAPTAQGQRQAINANNAGTMHLADKAEFEATHPGYVDAFEEWMAWAWSVNGQVR